jgi:23S rRNA (pseudouridine1915-N3)-methyltransferase
MFCLNESEREEGISTMLHVKIAAVGRLKERALQDLVGEYAKRLGVCCRFEIVEVADEKAPETLSAAQRETVMAAEAERLLRQVAPGDYVIALAIGGEMLSSEELAARLEKLAVSGRSSLVFLIGGSVGLGTAALRRADARLSLSRLTFPHQLARLILTEQLYRAFKINRNEPYHK